MVVGILEGARVLSASVYSTDITTWDSVTKLIHSVVCTCMYSMYVCYPLHGC